MGSYECVYEGREVRVLPFYDIFQLVCEIIRLKKNTLYYAISHPFRVILKVDMKIS